jgi:hypothetical protein
MEQRKHFCVRLLTLHFAGSWEWLGIFILKKHTEGWVMVNSKFILDLQLIPKEYKLVISPLKYII